MDKNMANKKSNSKVREKKSLVIDNLGDKVVIRNRSAIGAGVFGSIIIIFLIAVAIKMRAAWSSPMFWIIFVFLLSCSAYWCTSAVLGKIVLDSSKMLMTVYTPFKSEYQFKDVNYVELKSAKPKNGFIAHSISAYIGTGKRCVSVDTLSLTEAKEVESLLRGMLDNSDIESPEGNEAPIAAPQEKVMKESFLLAFKKRLVKPKAEKAEVDEIHFVTKATEPVASSSHSAEEERAEDDEIHFVTRATEPAVSSSHKTEAKDELDEYESMLIKKEEQK